MFFRKSSATHASDLDAPATIIGEGTRIESSLLTSQRSVRINGYYKGIIDIDSSLVLGDTGIIIGDVTAKYFLVAGEITGNINCSSQVHLASTARVYGDVVAASMVVDDGAKVSGRYVIGENMRNSTIVDSISPEVKFIDGKNDE